MRRLLFAVVILTGCNEGLRLTGHVSGGAGGAECEPETAPEPDCAINVSIDTGAAPVSGTLSEDPWTGETYCAIQCMSPDTCETGDDCFIDQCTFSQCIAGRCVNVSYEDGSPCIAPDPWTGEHHVGACDGCYCRPSP